MVSRFFDVGAVDADVDVIEPIPPILPELNSTFVLR